MVLNFMLLCWIPKATEKYDMISELNYAIDAAFRANDIEIPFPQRDIHLRSAKAAIRFQHDTE